MLVAVVTSSGRGIGRALAVRFAREGWRVVVNAKKGAEETLRFVKEAGGDGVVVMADVATREGCGALAQAALGLDAWVTTRGSASILSF